MCPWTGALVVVQWPKVQPGPCSLHDLAPQELPTSFSGCKTRHGRSEKPVAPNKKRQLRRSNPKSLGRVVSGTWVLGPLSVARSNGACICQVHYCLLVYPAHTHSRLSWSVGSGEVVGPRNVSCHGPPRPRRTLAPETVWEADSGITSAD